MKKIIFTIALFAIVLFASSGYNDSVVGNEPGKFAPQLTLTNDSATISLDDCRGHHVLLTFWSASDAVSRQQCNKYAAWTAANDRVKHLAVNFDTERLLFSEIVRRDGMDVKEQFNVQGDIAAQIASDYRLDGGFGSVLINPDGRIGAINPSIDDLTSLLE